MATASLAAVMLGNKGGMLCKGDCGQPDEKPDTYIMSSPPSQPHNLSAILNSWLEWLNEQPYSGLVVSVLSITGGWWLMSDLLNMDLEYSCWFEECTMSDMLPRMMCVACLAGALISFGNHTIILYMTTREGHDSADWGVPLH